MNPNLAPEMFINITTVRSFYVLYNLVIIMTFLNCRTTLHLVL